MSGHVAITDEILNLIGPGVADAARKNDEFTCVVCATDGSVHAGDDASVVVFIDQATTAVRYAHASCGNPQIVHTSTTFSPNSNLDVTSRAALVSGLGPVIMIRSTSALATITPSGDLNNAFIDALIHAGFELMLDAAQRPPRSKKVRLFIDDITGQGRLVDASGIEILDTLPPLPEGWATLAIRQQTVTVYAGTDLNLSTEPERFHDIIQPAVSNGALVALQAQVIKQRIDAPSQAQEAAQAIADDLKSVLSERARPGTPATSGINGRPDLITWSPRPTLYLAVHGTFPILVVDVGRDDTSTADQLREHGFETVTALDRPLAVQPPAEWSFLAWSSQIAILRGNDQKLLFDPIDGGHWYKTVQATSNDLLKVLAIIVGPIGATNGDNLPAALDEAFKRGDTVGATLHGMATH